MTDKKRASTAPWPHCDPRILHAPGVCVSCDHFADLQDIRKVWQIAYTGQQPQELADPAWQSRGAVLPCPADLIRGSAHQQWGNNRATPATKELERCAVLGCDHPLVSGYVVCEKHRVERLKLAQTSWKCADCGEYGAIELAPGKYGCRNGVECLARAKCDHTFVQGRCVRCLELEPIVPKITGYSLVCPTPTGCGKPTPFLKTDGGFLSPAECMHCGKQFGRVGFFNTTAIPCR